MEYFVPVRHEDSVILSSHIAACSAKRRHRPRAQRGPQSYVCRFVLLGHCHCSFLFPFFLHSFPSQLKCLRCALACSLIDYTCPCPTETRKGCLMPFNWARSLHIGANCERKEELKPYLPCSKAGAQTIPHQLRSSGCEVTIPAASPLAQSASLQSPVADLGPGQEKGRAIMAYLLVRACSLLLPPCSFVFEFLPYSYRYPSGAQ